MRKLRDLDIYKYEKYSVVGHMLLACVLNLLIEGLSRHSVGAVFLYLTGSPLVFLYNSFLLFTFLTAAYLFKRRNFARFLISVFWLGLGITNCVLLGKRVTPFNRADLKVALDAVTLLNQYFKPYQIVLLAVAVPAVVVLIIFVARRSGIYQGKLHRGLAAGVLALNIAAALFLTHAAIQTRILSDYFGNIAFAYEDYGFPYCFLSGCFNVGIDKPGAYSERTIEQIVQSGSCKRIETDSSKRPNIIVIQLESFFDPAEVRWLKTDKEPCETFRTLRKEYSSGYVRVPSVGAGTANTEFEILTGMNMRYFGPGEYPYKSILKEVNCESAASALSNLGYATHALHNNGGNFYSRATVFDHIGFDDFTSKEFMNITGHTENGWAQDSVLIDYMMHAMQQTPNSDFVFTITVQSHGNYPEEQVLEDPEIRITSLKEGAEPYAWEYYVNMVYEVDRFLANLINEIEKMGEDTVLVLYGDHLPSLDLEDRDLFSPSVFNTEYVIWDNIGLEKKDRNLTSYQLMAEVMDRVGFHTGTMFNYQQNCSDKLRYLNDLKLLQYDLLYGEQYVYEFGGLPVRPHMHMGLETAVIESAVLDENGILDIRGDWFTPWSKIYINGDKVGTRFYNSTNICTRSAKELEDGDEITVCQVGSRNTVFRSSLPYTYRAPEEPDEEETEPEENEADELSE